MANKFVISLGGSVAFPDGPDINFLRRFGILIKKEIKKSNRFVIVVGGGRLCRQYQEAAGKIAKVSSQENDWVGVYSTWLNARLVMAILQPSVCPVLFNERGKLKGFGQYPLVVGAGWKPGWSTDFIATQIAIDFGVKQVINLGKPTYVYTSNPDKDRNAKPITKLTWNEYFKIIPKQWVPGMNSPFDPVASRLAKKNDVKIIVAGGRNLTNFQKILKGEKFKGTVIENRR